MAKAKVSEWDVVSDNNIVINGININENCPPSAINNAIREMMAQIKQWQSGSSGDSWTSSGTLDITGSLRLDGNLGINGQVLQSSGSTATPTWRTLGSMASQNYSTVYITGGSVQTSGDLSVTGAFILDGSLGSEGQVMASKGSKATPVWTTLGTMSNQDSSNVTAGNLNVTGSLKLDDSVGETGQVIQSLGTTETPEWTTLGTMSNQDSDSVTVDDLNITGSLKLDGSVGDDGQVLKSVGTTETPVWTTLGTISNQDADAVEITGGKINGLSNLVARAAAFESTNTTGTVKYDDKAGTDGQVLTSKGDTETPEWTTLGSMSNQDADDVNITGGSITGITNLETEEGTISGDIVGAKRFNIGEHWSIVEHETGLYFQFDEDKDGEGYQSRMRLTKEGHLLVENNITAFKDV